MSSWKENKWIKILLIGITISIWGIAVYRFLQRAEEPDTTIALPTERNKVIKRAADHYSLMLNYADPFIREEEPVMEELTEMAVEVPEVKMPVNWPGISFKGLIVNRKTKKQLALLIVDGKQLLIEPGRKYENLIIERVYRDSVRLKLEDERKTYYAIEP